MTSQVKHREVVVRGVTYSVPTNVYWKEARGCWQVSVRWDKKSITDDFFPEHHNHDIGQTLTAAVAWARKKRANPTLKRDEGLRLGRGMHLDGRGALPDGISLITRQKYKGQPQPRVWQFKAYAGRRCIKVATIGNVEGYDPECYNAAFNVVVSALKLEREKSRLLKHEAGVNAMVNMTVQIQRGFRSRERLIDVLRAA